MIYCDNNEFVIWRSKSFNNVLRDCAISRLTEEIKWIQRMNLYFEENTFKMILIAIDDRKYAIGIVCNEFVKNIFKRRISYHTGNIYSNFPI